MSSVTTEICVSQDGLPGHLTCRKWLLRTATACRVVDDSKFDPLAIDLFETSSLSVPWWLIWGDHDHLVMFNDCIQPVNVPDFPSGFDKPSRNGGVGGGAVGAGSNGHSHLVPVVNKFFPLTKKMTADGIYDIPMISRGSILWGLLAAICCNNVLPSSCLPVTSLRPARALEIRRAAVVKLCHSVPV